MLVALGLLLLSASAFDVPELGASGADAPLMALDGEMAEGPPFLVTDAHGSDLPDGGLGITLGEAAPELVTPDGDAGAVQDPVGHDPQRLPPGGPGGLLNDPALHVGLPCVFIQGDMVSGSACPDDPFDSQRRVAASAVASGNVSAAQMGGEAPDWRWSSELTTWPVPFGVADTQPTPEPVGRPPAVALAPDDESVAPAPVSSGVVLAWVGRAAAMLAPTALLAKLLASSAVRRRQRESPARDALLALVAADPGIHYMELVRRSGLGNGTVQHHLRTLLDTGRLVRVRTSGHACFFPDAAADPAVVAVRAAARSAVTRDLLAKLAQGPRTLSGLAADAQLPVSTVHYHVTKLTRAGALAPQRVDGRRALALTPLGRAAITGP